MNLKRHTRPAAFLLLLGASPLFGCSHKQDETAPVTTEQQEQRISDNPNMPPAAKAAALKSIQENKARGAAMQQSAGSRKPE